MIFGVLLSVHRLELLARSGSSHGLDAARKVYARSVFSPYDHIPPGPLPVMTYLRKTRRLPNFDICISTGADFSDAMFDVFCAPLNSIHRTVTGEQARGEEVATTVHYYCSGWISSELGGGEGVFFGGVEASSSWQGGLLANSDRESGCIKEVRPQPSAVWSVGYGS